MKNEKGITLVALVSTIILIVILASISTYTGIESYNSMRVQAFVAKMTTLQEKVDVYCDKYTVKEINDKGLLTGAGDAGAVLNEVISMGASGRLNSWSDVDNAPANYRYFDTKLIEEEIGLKDFDVAIWLNPLTRNVIAVEGVTVDKVKYYRQYDLPGGQQLMQPVINENTTLDIQAFLTYNNKAEVKLNKKYAKIICNALDSVTSSTVTSTQVFTHTDTITLTESGAYQLIATDYDRTESDYPSGVAPAGLEKTSVKFEVTIVNKPMLLKGMKPVKWNASSNSWDEIDASDPTWYNYDVVQKEWDDATSAWKDVSSKRWANVKLADGSMYVWIPRFAYKITGTSIDIKFLSEFSNITTEGTALPNEYKVAPAFQNGVANSFANGEWNNEITGFWVAKYEANVVTKSGVKVPESKPSTETSTLVRAKDAFTYCRNMETITDFFDITQATTLNMTNSVYGTFGKDENNVDTHLMKNSELGAVLYLTYSQYGNSSISAQGSGFPGYISAGTLAGDVTTSTGNKCGVYGLAGGIREFTAGGANIATIYNNENISTQYATVYTNKTSIHGDGICETEMSGWTDRTTNLPDASAPLFIRGGQGDSGKALTYDKVADNDSNKQGFRPVMIVEY